MHALRLDISFGFRQLFQQPLSSAVAVITLALGIGVSTALFSVIDAAILRPLPYPDPEQLVRVNSEITFANGRTSQGTASMEDLRAWQNRTDVFSQVAGWGSAFSGRITDGLQPERLRVLHFTEDYLKIHGVAPVMGRDFTREDCEPTSPLVALLSHGYWQSRFGGRREVLGETIRLDSDLATVIGVLPAWFEAATPVATPLRVPLSEYSRRGTGRVSVLARLQPTAIQIFFPLQPTASEATVGMTMVVRHAANARDLVSRLRTEVEAIAPRVLIENVKTGEELFDQNVITPRRRMVLLTLLGVLGLTLALVGVFGVTAYAVVRRTAEIGVRLALGARPARVVNMMMRDAAAPVGLGVVLGVGGALLSTRVIDSFLFQTAANDAWTLAAVALTLAVTGSLAAFLPATRAARIDPATSLRAE